MGSLKLAWQKRYGDEWEVRWNAWRKKMSEVTSGDKNPMHGRHDHVHGLKRFAQEKSGKTLEEVHGEEVAGRLRVRRSESAQGSNNPAYGKIYANGGKSVKGHYKGMFFRSLLEYSFMKHLERRGLSLKSDVDYECFVVPYTLDDRQRTYRIDFFVRPENVAYEVKPAYVLRKPGLQQAKWDAARTFLGQRGIKFEVVTERDFEKVTFETARQDPDVAWKEETLKYFKKGKSQNDTAHRVFCGTRSLRED